MTSEEKKDIGYESLGDILKGSGLDESKVSAILNSKDSSQTKWQKISKTILTPQTPFKIHQHLFKETYKNDKNNYIWIPSNKDITNSNLNKLMTQAKKKNVEEYFKFVNDNREQFFETIINQLNIKFISRPSKQIYDLKNGVTKPIYLPNVKMNAVDSILIGDNVK